MISFLGSALWCTHGLLIQDKAIIFVNIVLFILNARLALKWAQPKEIT